MRKASSIVLLILLLLNAMGYYGVFVGLKIRNDVLMVQRMDLEDYDHSEAITIKIPMTIPYAMDAEDYQRVDGKFEYNGEFYRIVKQKLSKDTLSVVCIRDNEEKKIHEALSGFVKTFAENQTESPTNQKFSVTLIKDYLIQSFELQHISQGWESKVVKEGSLINLIPSFTSSILHPPERI